MMGLETAFRLYAAFVWTKGFSQNGACASPYMAEMHLMNA
jgi:hypothetical protein